MYIMAFLTDLDKSFALDSSHAYNYHSRPVVQMTSPESSEEKMKNEKNEQVDQLQQRIEKLEQGMEDLEKQMVKLEKLYSQSIGSSSSKLSSWFTL